MNNDDPLALPDFLRRDPAQSKPLPSIHEKRKLVMPKSAKKLRGMSKQQKIDERRKKRLAKIADKKARADERAKRKAEKIAAAEARAKKVKARAPKPETPALSYAPAPANNGKRPGRPARDYSVKPVIASEKNKSVQQLLDRIEDAAKSETPLASLSALVGTFKPSNTYYRMAQKYLDHQLALASKLPPLSEIAPQQVGAAP